LRSPGFHTTTVIVLRNFSDGMAENPGVPRLRVLSAILLMVPSCSPDIDLGDERQGPTAAMTAATSASGFRLLQPEDGAASVPINLSALLIQTPAPISASKPGVVAPFKLSAASGTSIGVGFATRPCPNGVAPELTCYALTPTERLSPASRYVVDVGDASWPDGTPVSSGAIGRFDTAPVADETPPVVANVVADVSECLRLQVSLSEPAQTTISVTTSGTKIELILPTAGVSQNTVVPLAALGAGLPANVQVTVVDAAGNVGQSEMIAIVTPDRPSLVISEVLVNPAGSEYTQEFVEIVNVGVVPLPLTGLTIEDSGGSDPLGTGTLAPGQRALVVAAGFIADEGSDPSPSPGAMLVRVEGRIGRDGLTNTGEAVTIKTTDGRVVDRWGGWFDMGATSWNGRSAHRTPPDYPCDGKETWTDKPQTPTPGW
jgi:Lamin Tail Domain